MASITIKGRAKIVLDEEDYVSPGETNPKILKRLHGVSSFESVVTWLNANEEEEALRSKIKEGGEIQLEYDEENNWLWVVTRYKTSVKLKPKELKLLKESTRGQWSDGFGTSFSDEIAREHDLFIDLFPSIADYDELEPIVEQTE